jgi:hypothetical protein
VIGQGCPSELVVIHRYGRHRQTPSSAEGIMTDQTTVRAVDIPEIREYLLSSNYGTTLRDVFFRDEKLYLNA